jgi:uncharacterized protein YpmB
MNTLGTILILSLTAIVIAIFIVLFVAYYNKKQSKQKMELQAKEVELQQSLLLNSLEVQEAEQKRSRCITVGNENEFKCIRKKNKR